VSVELIAGGAARPLERDAAGHVLVPELLSEGPLAVRATDEQGLSTEVVVREGGVMRVPEVAPEAVGGCACATPADGGLAVFGLLGLLGFTRRRR